MTTETTRRKRKSTGMIAMTIRIHVRIVEGIRVQIEKVLTRAMIRAMIRARAILDLRLRAVDVQILQLMIHTDMTRKEASSRISGQISEMHATGQIRKKVRSIRKSISKALN